MASRRYPVFSPALMVLGFATVSLCNASVIAASLGSVPGTASGVFPNNTAALEETFTLSSSGIINAYTTSYAGGGFQPNLTLFSSAGNYITSQSFSSSLAAADPTSGLALDSFLTANLSAGSYVILLTEFDYQLDASATILTPTSMFDAPIFPGFSDENGNSRTGAYSLTVAAAATPEPGTFWSVVPVLAGIFVLAKRNFTFVRQ